METVVCFDVDGTLITFEEQPRWDVIEILRLLRRNGCKVFIWSGGGADYARHWAEKLFIDKEVDGFRDKTKTDAVWLNPDICFDDEEVELAKVNIKI